MAMFGPCAICCSWQFTCSSPSQNFCAPVASAPSPQNRCCSSNAVRSGVRDGGFLAGRPSHPAAVPLEEMTPSFARARQGGTMIGERDLAAASDGYVFRRDFAVVPENLS